MKFTSSQNTLPIHAEVLRPEFRWNLDVALQVDDARQGEKAKHIAVADYSVTGPPEFTFGDSAAQHDTSAWPLVTTS